jgi:hypothetical protein
MAAERDRRSRGALSSEDPGPPSGLRGRRGAPAPLRPARNAALALAIVLGAAPGPAAAIEQTVNELWPELNVFVRTGDRTRLMALASIARAREFATSTEASYGLHYDWFAAELPEWWRTALPTMEGRWSLWFRLGYQRIEALGDDQRDENRLLGDMTLRSEPLPWALQIANRSRFELRDIGSDTSWRYRNRTRLERVFSPREVFGTRIGERLQRSGVGSLTPYAMLELFWDSRESRWNRRYQQYGVEVELDGGRALELYLAFQDQRRRESSYVTAIGVVYTLRY